jgi:hypothetical protein
MEPELPPRPPHVPVDALLIVRSKSPWWVKCSYKSGADICTVFNARGDVLIDNSVYLPYDGGAPAPEHELRISQHSMPQRLYLENGRILIQERFFDEIKNDIDAGRAGRIPLDH